MDDDAEARELTEQTRSLERIKLFACIAYFLIAGCLILFREMRGLLGLTCSSVVVMINFLWLEELSTALLQHSLRVSVRRVLVRSLSRFVLFGVALSVIIFIARFDVLSILLGFSIIVIGIMAEALYSVVALWRQP